MKYNKNFNLDDVLQIVGTVNEKYSEGSPEDEALRIAAVALLFVRDISRLDDLRDFFQKLYSPEYEVKHSHVFATREEADAWLNQGTAKDGELVSIAGQGFQVVIRPNRSFFLRTPLLEELRRKKKQR